MLGNPFYPVRAIVARIETMTGRIETNTIVRKNLTLIIKILSPKYHNGIPSSPSQCGK
jgi:hypothetical protein